MTEAVIGNTVRDAMDISAAFLELMQSHGGGAEMRTCWATRSRSRASPGREQT
jgi:NifU-like protein involved in Fe-S cluster formation